MESDYGLELQRIADEVSKLGKDKAKVCLQFPDGLKLKATEAVKELEKLTEGEASFYIWFGSNFGGCDYPWYLKDLEFDLLVNFGHTIFKK